ncbi:MAG TPA: F420-0--gamma-glutamyl ligase [Candidatus Avimonas sp.]|nr:F420-0--gamma-glutamyl ligase [Candidatus Avimonas sp.]
MSKWYIGNLNLQENRREKNGVTYYVRGVREVEGIRFERYAIKTHFIERGEDYVELARRYILPIYKPGDIAALGEKVISMCQNNTVEMKDVKLGFWAKFLSRFATRTKSGIGMDEPYKLQLAINMKGLPRILLGVFCGAVCRVFGVRGVFYRIVGKDVAGIDGFYKNSVFKAYHTLAVLNPRDPDGVCEKIEKELGIACMISDANDINIELLGRSPSLKDKSDEFLSELIKDNPAGQDDELTPFILIRDIGDAPAEPYKPVQYVSKEEAIKAHEAQVAAESETAESSDNAAKDGGGENSGENAG